MDNNSHDTRLAYTFLVFLRRKIEFLKKIKIGAAELAGEFPIAIYLHDFDDKLVPTKFQ